MELSWSGKSRNWNSHDELEEDYIRTPPVIPEKEEEITNKKKDEYKYLNVNGESITSGSSKIPTVTLHEEFTPTESEIMLLKKMREESYKTPEPIKCIDSKAERSVLNDISVKIRKI